MSGPWLNSKIENIVLDDESLEPILVRAEVSGDFKLVFVTPEVHESLEDGSEIQVQGHTYTVMTDFVDVEDWSPFEVRPIPEG